MKTSSGWRELRRRQGAESFVVSPFTRLARVHAAAVAGDALVAIALADSLFFSIDPKDARWRVFLYLALTMAPFAIVAPLIGPALDRTKTGRRWMMLAAQAGRVVLCVMLVRDFNTLLLFPEAFGLLVCSKSYHVAKSALVPTTVANDSDLVRANSRLSLLSGIMGFLAAIPGGIALKLGGAQWVIGLAFLAFAIASYLSLRVPTGQVASEPASPEERSELRSGTILLSASAMGLMRGIVGFLTFLLAFGLRTDGSPTWHFGVVLGASLAGQLFGATVAPVLRRTSNEERILELLLALTCITGLTCGYVGGLTAAALLAGAVGIAAGGGKQAFDSIVQRDAPDANRGRSFARFETRFQVIWVLGAILPVLIHIPLRLGYVMVAAVAGFAVVSYVGGSRRLHRSVTAEPPEDTTPDQTPVASTD